MKNKNIDNVTDSKSLGFSIRERRKELKYTQTYVSDFTGFSISFISDVERGKEIKVEN